MRTLELRRHAPRDPDEDRVSEEGQRLAEQIGRSLPGKYDVVWVSPARRAAESAAWMLRGLGQQLPQEHGVAEELGSPVEDRWRAAAKEAGTGRVDAIAKVDPDLVEAEGGRLAEGTMHLLRAIPEGRRGLAVGHTPLIEAAVYGLTGTTIEPLRECEGVLLEEDGGRARLAGEYRRED